MTRPQTREASRPARTRGKSDGELRFSLWQRVILAVVPGILWALVWLVSKTWRYELIAEDGVEPLGYGQRSGRDIFCFWHQCVLPAGVFFAHSHTVVMISRSFDGELVTRFARHINFGAVRGSSSNRAREGIMGLKHVVETGRGAVFTADGPRGPIHRTKAGPIKLAQITGVPIRVFHVESERAWVLNSWDRFMIPKPFTRICVSWAPGVSVPAEMSDSEFEAKREELNAAINRARHNARAYFGKDAE